jgi:hypothetical protein
MLFLFLSLFLSSLWLLLLDYTSTSLGRAMVLFLMHKECMNLIRGQGHMCQEGM